ncbi:MAG: glycosyltransferase family 2 protein [Steroidobacteraceae bacterium]
MDIPAKESRPARPHVTFVVPAYNEAEALPALLARIAAAADNLSLPFETLVIDDGSNDGTAAAARNAPAALNVRLLRLSRNFGKEAALTAGIDHADGDVVLCLDSDGQHPPEMLGEMLELWRAGHDMVYGVRTDRGEESFFKRIGSRTFYSLMRSGSRIDIPENAGDFRLMDRCVINALRALPERRRFMKGIFAWVGFDAVGIPYSPEERQGGRSHYSRRKLTQLAWSGFTSFTALPLRVAVIVGAVLALLAMAYGGYLIVEYTIFGTAVPGWPTVVVSIMFLSGLQFLFIGIVGEYLARVFEEVKARPTYLIAEDRKRKG